MPSLEQFSWVAARTMTATKQTEFGGGDDDHSDMRGLDTA
jgi:hypothetical protein